MNAAEKIPTLSEAQEAFLRFHETVPPARADVSAFSQSGTAPLAASPLEEENARLRAKLRQEKRDRRIMELRNRFHAKIEEILSGLDRVSDIRNLFDYLLYEAPKILGCRARFHFIGLGPFLKTVGHGRRTELFDDLSEIFKTSLVAYLSIYGNAEGRINAHSGNVFERNEAMEYIPVILENYRTDPGAAGRSHVRTEPLHTGTRTVIGYVEAPKRSNERRSFEPEAAARKIMRSLRSHLEEISNGLLMEVHKRNACIDPLTETLNRRGFFETVEKLRRGSADLAPEDDRTESMPSQSSVIMLDLDHFKSVNDQYGHEIGDQVLRYVARTVSESIEGVEGACIGRFWGEEFVVYLQGHSIESAGNVAENVRSAIERGTVGSFAGPLKVTASLGASECEHPQEWVDRAISRSDRAMYRAKRSGRNRVARYDARSDAETVTQKPEEPIVGTQNRRLDIRDVLETLLREES